MITGGLKNEQKKDIKKAYFFLKKYADKKKQKKKMKKKLKTLDPEKYFKNTKLVGKGLLKALEDNDKEAFIEILDAYLKINKS